MTGNKRVIAQQDDSENDLNKNHELTDDESADTQETNTMNNTLQHNNNKNS